MAVLVICRGIPASGKTTWAREWVSADPQNRVRVNKDDLRGMIYTEFIPGVTEGRVNIARDQLIDSYLKSGISVVSDDTNLKARTVKELLKIARKNKAVVQFQDFDIDMAECVIRDLSRPDAVGYHVIEEMYNKFVKNGFPAIPVLDSKDYDNTEIVPYEMPEGIAPHVFIFDIDGTLAIHNGRDPFDESLVYLDEPNWPVIEMMDLIHDSGYKILIVSGRTKKCEDATREWLDKYLGEIKYELFMREIGDGRKDYRAKLDIFNDEIRNNYRVLGVFDDRDQVVQLWRDLGIQCYQVNYGDF